MESIFDLIIGFVALFSEQYFHERCNMLFFSNREKNVVLFPEVEAQAIGSVDNCMNETADEEEVEPHQTSTSENEQEVLPQDYAVSELTSEEESFFSSLQESLAQHSEAEEGDYLSLNDLQEELENKEAEQPAYHYYETEKIANAVIGEQTWIARVVGYERDYVHLSDGHKIWVHVGEKVKDFKQHALMEIEVDRQSDVIKVLNYCSIEEGIDHDYVIYDEIAEMDRAEYEAAI